MTPAKEVGGDLYDFFLIDDDHLGMVIGDASGEGRAGSTFHDGCHISSQKCVHVRTWTG